MGRAEKKKINIYTDGAARGNPGPAGWGAVFVSGDRVIAETGGKSKHATNNQMELTAVIEALKWLKKSSKMSKSRIPLDINVASDSKYVILGITEWIHNWRKNNWRNANKKPVLNRALWEELYALAREVKPEWCYVEGHTGDRHNERADEIATSFADGKITDLKNAG